MKYSKILAVIHWATWLAPIEDKQWLGEISALCREVPEYCSWEEGQRGAAYGSHFMKAERGFPEPEIRFSN